MDLNLTPAEQIRMYDLLNRSYSEVVRLYIGAERLYELKRNRHRFKTVNFFRTAVTLKFNEELEIDRQDQIKEAGYVYSKLGPNHLPFILPDKRPRKNFSYVSRFCKQFGG